MLRHLCCFCLFLFPLLLYFNPSLAYSLQNCIVKFPVHDADVSVDCSERNLHFVPNDIPINATALDLSVNAISTFNRTHFRGLSKLGSLKIVTNALSHIDDGSFEDCVELTFLDLEINELRNLTDHIFQGLSKLTHLNLIDNFIEYISPLAFQSLTSLQTVDLTNNNLDKLSDIVPILRLPNFRSLKVGLKKSSSFESNELPIDTSNLRELSFNGWSLRKFSITRDIFPYLEHLGLYTCSPGFEWDVADRAFVRSLKSLFIGGTHISFETYRAILNTCFAVENLMLTDVKAWLDKGLIHVACQMPALKNLNLTLSTLYLLNDTLLETCSNITTLDLSNNQMADLSENSLRSLNRLETLKLSRNYLMRVPVAIGGLSKLVILDLRSNNIGAVDCTDFMNLSSLIELNLEENHISVLRGCAFRDLDNLKHINVQKNPIFLVLDSFREHLHNLVTLDMGMTDFRHLREGEFSGVPSLQTLNLKSDTDCNVEFGTFYGLHLLERLVLSADALNQEMFIGMPTLKSLTLRLSGGRENHLGNQIDTDSKFIHLPLLRSLSITNSNNWAQALSPDLLRGLQYLDEFSADNLFITTPHQATFSYTPHLRSLQIINHYAPYLKPELFQPIPDLQFLDLSKNNLRSLDFLSQTNLSSLRALNLKDNKLTVINATVFQVLPALIYLNLYGNPFSCNCLNTGFIQWVKNNKKTQVINAYQYECYFPSTKQGTKVLEFDIKSCYMDLGFLFFISSTCLVLLTLLTSFTYNFLRWHIACAFYLFLAYIYDSRKRKKRAPNLYDAFISYNVADEAWVYREMIPVLEGEQGWRLCLHHRDFQPGKPIIENIMDAIYSSHKTICVITRRYLQSEWCSREIQMASFRLFDEMKDVLILLFLEEIPYQELSPYYRMRKLVRRRTYLSWPKAGQHTGVFWQKVRRALETGNSPKDDTNLLTASLTPQT